jgi:secreted trypsin-like serine protease
VRLYTINVDRAWRKGEQLIVYIIMFIKMIAFSVLFIFSIFDVTTSIAITCDRRAICGCSKRATVVISRIIGGEPVTLPNLWGWIASLRLDDMHQCGASLITPSHVITAAHCLVNVRSLSRLSLNFGITNLSDIGQLRNVTKMYIHPLYDQGSYANDIAILRLEKPFNLADSDTSCICLPTISETDLKTAEYPPIGSNLVAIGWGSTDPFMRIASPVLRQVTVQAIAQTDPSCSNSINDPTLQFCAGVPEGGKDTCAGDSGGPLMLFKDGRWSLVGLTSYGEICGSPGFAGVYTRVAYYESYIRQTLISDGAFVPYARLLFGGNESRSNTESLYQQSMIQIYFICIFIVCSKFFYRN